MNDKPSIDDARQYYQLKDDEHWARTDAIAADSQLGLRDVLLNYPAFVRRRELVRVWADYDLFRMVADLPGSIVELGVFMGAGLFTWSKLLETFRPGDRSRKVFGFESGEGYTDFSPEDGDPTPWIERVVGRKEVPAGFLEKMVALSNQDNLIAGVERCRVISGDILKTVPAFAEQNQGTRLCLLFLDVNLYRPTLAGLRAFYPLMVPGGVIALNGYGSPPWQGEAMAFETYFKESGLPLPALRKLSYSIRPGAYFIKE